MFTSSWGTIPRFRTSKREAFLSVFEFFVGSSVAVFPRIKHVLWSQAVEEVKDHGSRRI